MITKAQRARDISRKYMQKAVSLQNATQTVRSQLGNTVWRSNAATHYSQKIENCLNLVSRSSARLEEIAKLYLAFSAVLDSQQE